jgi:methylenetetrahydrofolate dehydrogenase (NADP+)/methenyltetrahydrofolate cyclohydrolase
METKVITGEHIKDRIFDEIKVEIEALKSKTNQEPGIAFIGFKEVPLAKYVIPLHVQTAQAAGFNVTIEIMPEKTSEEDMFKLIDFYNQNKDIHAILVLQPLPVHLNPVRIINRVDQKKEVEGFHPLNMLSTLIPDIKTNLYPMCLPSALVELLTDAQVELKKDQEWVFALDDEFVSNPLTIMVVKSAAAYVVPVDCSCTIINKDSKHLIDYCKRADILVIVSKNPEYVQPEWLKPGVCIIDVYSNLVKEVTAKNDSTKLIPIIRGGVNVESVKGIAGAVVPVPGGVVAVVLPILLRNALTAFKNSLHPD